MKYSNDYMTVNGTDFFFIGGRNDAISVHSSYIVTLILQAKKSICHLTLLCVHEFWDSARLFRKIFRLSICLLCGMSTTRHRWVVCLSACIVHRFSVWISGFPSTGLLLINKKCFLPLNIITILTNKYNIFEVNKCIEEKNED